MLMQVELHMSPNVCCSRVELRTRAGTVHSQAEYCVSGGCECPLAQTELCTSAYACYSHAHPLMPGRQSGKVGVCCARKLNPLLAERMHYPHFNFLNFIVFLNYSSPTNIIIYTFFYDLLFKSEK